MCKKTYFKWLMFYCHLFILAGNCIEIYVLLEFYKNVVTATVFQWAYVVHFTKKKVKEWAAWLWDTSFCSAIPQKTGSPRVQDPPKTPLIHACIFTASSSHCCHGNLRMKRVTCRLNEIFEVQPPLKNTQKSISSLDNVPQIHVDSFIFTQSAFDGL